MFGGFIDKQMFGDNTSVNMEGKKKQHTQQMTGEEDICHKYGAYCKTGVSISSVFVHVSANKPCSGPTLLLFRLQF